MKALFKTLLLAVLVFGISSAVYAQESKTKKEKHANSYTEAVQNNPTDQLQQIENYEVEKANKPESRTRKADRIPTANASQMAKSANSATNKEAYYAKREKLIQSDKRGSVNSKLSTEKNSNHPNAISPAEAQKYIKENESLGTKGNSQSTNE